MGKSADFSEGIKIIREAHDDAGAILSKWRELIESPGDVTLRVKGSDGEYHDVVMPSIRSAITKYLGSTFESITLDDGHHKVIIRLTSSGTIELVNGSELPANVSAASIIASTISGRGGNLTLIGNVQMNGGSISGAEFQDLNANTCQIYGSEFRGQTTISGGATITGSATIHNATVESLNAGIIQYRKQVLDWAHEGTVDSQIAGPVSGGLWTGDVATLERAGIGSAPTWSDCQYIPGSFAASTNTVGIYWGETGTMPVVDTQGNTGIATTFMALWPYKMYEKVGNSYRIRWLPFNNLGHRITYLRTGNLSGSVYVPLAVKETTGASGPVAMVALQKGITAYNCRRLISDLETDSGETVSRLYGL